MSAVKIINATKKYGDIQVIHGIDLDIKDGEFCVFVGPSGCGKSTLLRMISGLEEVTSGDIHIGDKNVTKMQPADRGIAMVFQSYALYPHMTVRENMAFGLKMTKVPAAVINEKVNEAASILHLEPYLDRKPKTLSGGQRQRVAIGRAIVRGPEVFLFDEPLSNLDAELRVEMRVEITRLHRELGTTIIYVTHDQVEAMTLADKIVVLKEGRIQQVGTPLSLYDDPQNIFVAGFIGSPTINLLKGSITDGKLSIPSLETLKLDVSDTITSLMSELIIGLRPQHLKLAKSGDLEVEFTEALGDISYIYLKTQSGDRVVVESRDEKLPSTSAKVGIEAKTSKALFFDPKTELRVK
ncbi:MAG: sn-glycerol-3-phosphate ABC transporter ATP-binding protein UgpC [Candidatus Thioglobus sp.]|jgi:lactose/L-arabinose transport system ATP-binding protein|nr:sn-glycerol-3-phosphate ABC transporter ATP-binding protein UgpC [Candidatus Thioglobus sp.]|tara:strand:+ start:383 stop:1441 length:1059 start_codon:yes stop_codon:yes gene_type:complete